MAKKNLEKLVDAAMTKKPSKMKGIFEKEMAERVKESVKSKKKEVAKSVFGSEKKN